MCVVNKIFVRTGTGEDCSICNVKRRLSIFTCQSVALYSVTLVAFFKRLDSREIPAGGEKSPKSGETSK